MAKDYYQILGVDKNATPDEIKQAYRRLALKHHPDKNGGAGNEQIFKEANEAYQVLSDENKRQQYDQFGQTFAGAGGQGFAGFDFNNFRTQDGAGFGDFGDIFETFFGGAATRRRRPTDIKRGHDLEANIDIALDDAIFGGAKEISLNHNITCTTCAGTGSTTSKQIACSKCSGRGQINITRQTVLGAFRQVRICPECRGLGEVPEKICRSCRGEGRVAKNERITINIPVGIDTGQTIRISGQGHAGLRGGKSGDLYITVHILPHNEYKRDGFDLHKPLVIPFTTAVLGGKVKVGTFFESVDVKIPAASKAGDVLRVREYGVPKVNSSGKGDLYLVLDIDVPKRLTLKQRKLLQELDQEFE